MMKPFKSWWTAAFVLGAVASAGGLLDWLWNWIGLDFALAVSGIGFVCILRGVVRFLFTREQAE